MLLGRSSRPGAVSGSPAATRRGGRIFCSMDAIKTPTLRGFMNMAIFQDIRTFLSIFAVGIPVFFVCFVAVVVILINWKTSSGAVWALVGFAILLFLSFAMPVVQTGVQHWLLTGENHAARLWVYSAVGFCNSLLHALAYSFLLAAIVAGRSTNNTAA